MKRARGLAARALGSFYEQSANREDIFSNKSLEGRDFGEKYLKDIDDVLDFFEEFGFYVKGDQITPEFAHQSFGYWIEVYYLASARYIALKQERVQTSWEHLRYLYQIARDVERERSGDKFDEKIDYDYFHNFLRDEIALVTTASD